MIQTVTWKVLHWKKLWRTLWFPTANISLTSKEVDFWVYITKIGISGTYWNWVWTYLEWKNLFEVHIFDFNEDIYWKNIEIILLKKIRENKKFESFDDLKKQIAQDKKQAQETELNVLTFGSFDHIHPWHEYYLKQASKYGNKLITIVASDENIKKIKSMAPLHSLNERIESLRNLKISEIIEPGSNSNPMKWLEIYKPHVICLGYDQRWKFVERLPEELKKIWFKSKIIRSPSYKPDIFKSSLLKKKNTEA